MTSQYTMFADFLNVTVIRNLLTYLLDQFIKDLEHPHSSIQDLSALSITWICTFIPEAVPAELIEKLEETLDRETAVNWDLFIPLRTALFAITEDVKWMNIVYNQVDHRTSNMRVIVLESLALVAPLLNFYRRDLTRAILHNLESNNMYALESFYLTAAWTDISEERKDFLLRARAARVNNGWNTQTLDTLLQGQIIENLHFCDLFSRISRFLALSTWLVAISSAKQADQDVLELTVADILDRIKNHPLSGSYIQLQNLDFD